MIKIRFVFFLSFLVFLTACKVENQKSDEIFYDSVLPRILFRIANQIHELVSLEDQIIKNPVVCSPDCLDVAVIDSGVDIAHPDLYSKIRFDIDGGKIVGAGFDFLGNDSFASANLIDPTLFAFGAETINGGRIKNPPLNPLDLIVKYNESFMNALEAEIQSTASLKGTLFDNLKAQQTSLYELHRIANNKEAYLKEYEQNKKTKGVLRRGQLAYLQNNTSIMDPALYYLLETNPWRTFIPTKGAELEGFDVLIQLTEKVLKSFPDSTFYYRDLQSLMDYLEGRNFDESTTSLNRVGESLDLLGKALEKKLYAHLHQDSIYNLVYLTEVAHLQGVQIKGQSYNFLPSEKPKVLAEALEESFKLYGELLKHISEMSNLTLSEKINATEKLKVYTKFQKISQWVGKDRRLVQVPNYSGYQPHFDSHLYRKRFVRTSHPFVSEKSAEQSHGSHVAGIINSQSENLRIVPVRVSTESLQLPKDIRNQYVNKFKMGFGDWLKDPLIFRALGSKLSKWYPHWNFLDTSESNRARVSGEIIQLLNDSISLSVDQGLLDHVFIEEIVKAVRYVGAQKIKVANISLGTSFERPVPQLGPENPLSNLKNFFQFLKFEYFKYKIGQEIRASALQTVFVVAAGNESTWVDGQSRSALPVDISSPFLMPFERPDRGEVAPNNGLKNIIAVGSLNSDDQLSNFTNIFLGKHVPFVFARGEMILSAIKSTDMSGIQQALDIWQPSLDGVVVLSPKDLRLRPFLTDLWKKMSGSNQAPSHDQLEYMTQFMSYKMLLVLSHSAFFRNHLAVKFSEHRARLSGTSMASPMVAGALGKMILEKKERLSLSGENIYEHPQFKAEDLVKELLTKTEPLDPANNLYGLRKLIGPVEMKDTQQELDRFLQAL